MATLSANISINTKGMGDIINITDRLQAIVNKNNIDDGLLCAFIPGSTAAITTIEYEPGLKKDINIFLEKLIPYNANYYHHQTWNDDNGSSHLRASLIGPSITIPITDRKLILGTWQQVIFIECDTRSRSRNIIVKIVY